MKQAGKFLLAAIGVAAFVSFFRNAGSSEIWKACAHLGHWAPLLLLPYFFVYIADAWGWKLTLPPYTTKRVSYWDLFRVRWAGEALNNVVPTAYIGGEALKVFLLQKRGLPTRDTSASVILSRTAQTLTQVLFILLGSLALVWLHPLSEPIRRSLLVLLSIAIVLLGFAFWLQRRGIFKLLFGFLDRLRWQIRWLQSRRSALESMDDAITQFYRDHPGRFAASATWYMTGWLLDSLDVFLAAWLMGSPISWLQALSIESFIGIAKVLGLMVPGALGVQESSIVLICRWVGLPDVFGVTYALIRRARETVYAALGGLLLYAEHSNHKVLKSPIGISVPHVPTKP